jgi:hypothetical protein
MPSKAAPPAWKVELAPDALDGLYGEASGPVYPLHCRLWAWIIERLPWLKQRYAGPMDLPRMPEQDPDLEAKMLAALCRDDFREIVLAILAPGIRAIAQNDARRKAGAP